ncbi:hypothetical protein K493DRAFT_306853 [Basidiobolus meristosporus CBS 931.73]|uniref:Pectin lyase-like protein n=1 Tax=Basidiobolus meristosporus CBS 931.73 TaxID=1314790 RepID=A0A1Y1XPF8_9FUNG|nr:hypothetical protein K493DRAFT_306853 [Basidiobolus meristosporus CBS 931.73]|eukprot:ORX87630.1 hypothetical protein K493DRAFT_306853 [Basidiobolus meristosporus CBS 931.73]
MRVTIQTYEHEIRLGWCTLWQVETQTISVMLNSSSDWILAYFKWRPPCSYLFRKSSSVAVGTSREAFVTLAPDIPGGRGPGRGPSLAPVWIYEACVFALFAKANSIIQPSAKPGDTNLLQLTSDFTCYNTYTDLYDILPDFSYAGYEAGVKPIPEGIPNLLTLTPSAGNTDDTTRVQEAVNALGSKPIDSGTGYRGALLLQSGVYRISQPIMIGYSGVIIRGDLKGNTTIVATGKSPYTVFHFTGSGEPERSSRKAPITGSYVSVGSFQVQVAPRDITEFSVGDDVIVGRVGNDPWIRALGMNDLSSRDPEGRKSTNWTPFDLLFTRSISYIDAETGTIILDSPLTSSFEDRWGGGYIYKYGYSGRISHVGIEYLNGISVFNPAIKNVTAEGKSYYSDEEHAESFVTFEKLQHGYARNLSGKHFNNFVVTVNNTRWVTVQDCDYSEPVSLIEGTKRYAYFIEDGSELILHQRNYASQARHAFIVGARVTGPNVFYNCTSVDDYDSSEPHHRWSVGGLYDNVSANIAVQDREYYGTGHGWAGANYVLWNTNGTAVVQKPPTAMNFAIGVQGAQEMGAFPERAGPGYWESHGTRVEPASLYQWQLNDRLNRLKVAH